MEKETIELVKKMIEDGNLSQEIAEKYCPELKESEDERIRKSITEFFKNFSKNGTWKAIPDVTKWIAWLEKQKDKEPDMVEPKFKVGDKIVSTISGIPYCITEVCNGHYATDTGCIIMFCAQDNFEIYKQKPAWSEEDESWFKELELMALSFSNDDSYRKKFFDWIKSLKERVIPQPKTDWSEEEENTRKKIIKFLKEQNYFDGKVNEFKEPYKKEYEWLKSLRPPYYCDNCKIKKSIQGWKPSDKQIIALRWVLNNIPYNIHKEEISGLFEKLKSL